MLSLQNRFCPQNNDLVFVRKFKCNWVHCVCECGPILLRLIFMPNGAHGTILITTY